MYEIRTYTGRIVEARRYLNRALRIRDFDPSRERWELWVVGSDGSENKFIVYSRSMPARCGHTVIVLTCGILTVGLYNLDIAARVNFTRADPALLVRPWDSVVVVALLFAAFAAFVAGATWIFALMVPLALAYIPSLALLRLMGRTVLQREVDQMLDEVESGKVVLPFRRRR